MKKFLVLGMLVALTIIGLGCGSSNSSNSSNSGSNSATANVFMTGEDAPLSSVVGFNVTLNSGTLNGQDGKTATVISTPVTVDFARLVGLRAPLAFNAVAPDTYVSATFVMASPVISYVDLTQNPPALNTINGTFPNGQTPYSLTVNFATPMVVGNNGLAGLRMDMDIRKSVAVDQNGTVTGAVNPVIYVKATKASDSDGKVTDLMGGLVSVAAASNSFVLQGPYGRQLTVYVSNTTQFNSGWSINNMAAPAFVAVQGMFQADGSLMASGVEVITTAHSFISGRVLQVTANSSGQAQQITMWVGETGADMVSDVDTIMTVDVSQVTTYEVCFLDGPLTNFAFNDTSVVVGQRIFIGGSFASNTFTPTMISLRRQGVYGTFVPGSVTGTDNAGSFQISNNGLVGYSVGGPVTVNTFSLTDFDGGLSGLSTLQSTTTPIPIVTRGLLLKSLSGSPELYAGYVSEPQNN